MHDEHPTDQSEPTPEQPDTAASRDETAPDPGGSPPPEAVSGSSSSDADADAVGLVALRRVPWKALTAAFFVLPAIMTFFPQFMYEQFMVFVSFSGAFLTAICGVALADYFVLRRQHIDLRELHLGGHGRLYAYTGGVNWAGIVAVIAGAAFYVARREHQTAQR